MAKNKKTLRFDCALLPDGWAEHVAVQIDDTGTIAAVERGVAHGQRIAGCLLPGVPNLHSHAHQRAMAGLAERSGEEAKRSSPGDTEDSFWTWREVMYRHVGHMQPHHLQAIAAQLYVEMLEAGYTSVAEFQYLHHDPDGAPYDNPAEMSLRTLAAAREAGIGISNLPVLYRYSGFGEKEALASQRRFVNDADGFLRIVAEIARQSRGDPNVTTGIAPHSLRAVSKDLLGEVMSEIQRHGAMPPVHIHIAEQVEEVADCLAWSGLGPVEWLLDNFAVGPSWCLVHATHMTEAETEALAASGAVAGLCPTTEANLGDGLFNAEHFVRAGGHFGIGSDSHVSVDPVEELRWLEYGQRLEHGRRNILAGGPGRSTGRQLFDRVVAGGARACGRNIGRIEAGCRADLIVIDTDHPALEGRREDTLLDSWIFAGKSNLVRDVYVGGELVVQNGVHARREEIRRRFRRTASELAGGNDV